MEKKQTVIIFQQKLARDLLKKGYTIIDIKPNKFLMNGTVFVFKVEREIYNEIDKFKEIRNKS